MPVKRHVHVMVQAVSAEQNSLPVYRNRETGRRTLTPGLTARLHARLARTMARAITQALGEPIQPGAVCDLIAEFEAVYAARPVRENTGGSRYNDSLWLYVVARICAPRLIIESGTHRGHSAWLLSKAAPEAAIRSYDICHENLAHREDGVAYVEADWTTEALTAPASGKSLIFFDDHISHARRLTEAADRGFDLVLLDDNFPASVLYATGAPPVPTLDMIMKNNLPDGYEITWTKSGKNYSYVVDRQEITAARKLIAKAIRLPDLSAINAYHRQSGLSVVQLRL